MIRLCGVHFQLVKKRQQVLLHFIMSEVERRKLVMIGDGAVGKTSLLEAFNGDEFVENRYRPSILHAAEPRMKHPTLDGVEVALQL